MIYIGKHLIFVNLKNFFKNTNVSVEKINIIDIFAIFCTVICQFIISTAYELLEHFPDVRKRILQ